MTQHIPDALLVIAVAFVVAGVALLSIPASFIVAGAGCGLGAYIAARTEADS